MWTRVKDFFFIFHLVFCPIIWKWWPNTETKHFVGPIPWMEISSYLHAKVIKQCDNSTNCCFHHFNNTWCGQCTNWWHLHFTIAFSKYETITHEPTICHHYILNKHASLPFISCFYRRIFLVDLILPANITSNFSIQSSCSYFRPMLANLWYIKWKIQINENHTC